MHPTTQYAADVVTGNIDTCKNEWLACERHLKDLKRQGTDGFPFVFDETRADRAFKWYEKCCRHVRGVFQGKPLMLEDFQKFDLGCLLGWVHMDTGRRRFKRMYKQIGRGNYKSTEMSGLALYGLCSDAMYPPGHTELRRYENMPEIECAAVDRGQARRVWGDAQAMAQGSPDIAKRLDIKKTYVAHKTRGGWMRPLSKDTKNKDSGAPCIVIVDEYHAHPTSEIHDTLFSGFGKRAQALMAIITTAGANAANNPCKKEYDTCVKILSGEIDAEDYFVIIRELDKDDNPHDKTKWQKANPALRSGNAYAQELLSQIESEYNLAYSSGDPSKIREFLIKRMDIWQMDSEDKYFTGCVDKWDAAALPRIEFLQRVRNAECWVGLDLSKNTDLTATGYVFPLADGTFAVCAHGFIPEDAADEHEKSDRVPYKFWAQENWCTLTRGAVTDYDFVKEHMRDMALDEGWRIREYCFDPYNATHFITQLRNEVNAGHNPSGSDDKFIEVRQGCMTLSEPTKKLRELVLSGKIIHDGSPLLRWCLMNAVEIRDSNDNIRLSKKHKDDSQRIDLAAAIINAMSRAIRFTKGPDLNKRLEEGWRL